MEDSWALEVVPRLPANLVEQARSKPFSGVRKLCDPSTTSCGVYWLMSWDPPLDAPAGCLGGAGGGRRYFRCVA